MKRLKFIFGSTVFKLENVKVCYWAMSKIFNGRGTGTYFQILGDICCVGEAYNLRFCSTTKYSPFMIYLHLQNRLISNSHWSTYYNTLLYVCEGVGYCELLVNFADFLFILHPWSGGMIMA